MNRRCVSLHKFRRACPSCHFAQDIRTRNGRTVITAQCAPWCRLNNTLLGAGMSVRRLGAELLPADDSRERKTA